MNRVSEISMAKRAKAIEVFFEYLEEVAEKISRPVPDLDSTGPILAPNPFRISPDPGPTDDK